MTTDELLAALTKEMAQTDKRNEEILDIMIGKKPRPEKQIIDNIRWDNLLKRVEALEEFTEGIEPEAITISKNDDFETRIKELEEKLKVFIL